MLTKDPKDLQNSGSLRSTDIIARGKKNIKEKKLDILVSADKSNIEKSVQELLQKFNPPFCSYCIKRRADRVCVNKACGPQKYQQIICGRCHSDSHSQAVLNPDLSIQEYLTRLFLFSKEQDLKSNLISEPTIDFDKLDIVLKNIQSAKNELNSLKCFIKTLIEGQERPEQRFSNVQDCVMKALSLCECSNICNQLQLIKKYVIFEDNEFLWKEKRTQFDQFRKETDNLNLILKNLLNSISKSFSDDKRFNLNELYIRWNVSTMPDTDKIETHIRGENDIITINAQPFQRQMYLDYKLVPELKYRLRFTFLVKPTMFNIVGIAPLSVVNSEWVCNSEQNTLFKSFQYHQPLKDCNKIIKGMDLKMIPVKGTQIEMRVDIKNRYIDFSDYPKYSNINSNQKGQVFRMEPYVFVFALCFDQSLSIDSIDIIDQIEER